MEAGSTSETSINFYRYTRLNIQKTAVFIIASMRT
jgi:hypothetical protein